MITNSSQNLALECVRQLQDKKKGCFGIYMRFIKKHGEFRVRSLLSEVSEQYRLGKITSPAKIFMYLIKKR